LGAIIPDIVASEDRDEFRILMQGPQTICRRNGAFQCRLGESLDQPGLFHLEYHVSTRAEHLRQTRRMTIEETRIFKRASNLDAGESEPIVRHFLSAQTSGRTLTDTSGMPKPRLVAVTSEA
jgi:Transmembrane secretion effector